MNLVGLGQLVRNMFATVQRKIISRSWASILERSLTKLVPLTERQTLGFGLHEKPKRSYVFCHHVLSLD